MPKSSCKLGVISVWWPPVHGGAELYAYRLARVVRGMGVPVGAFTGSPRVRDRRANGDFKVVRAGEVPPPGDFSHVPEFLDGGAYERWCSNAVDWATSKRMSHVVINQPLRHALTRRLVENLKRKGIKVGLGLHSTPRSLLSRLVEDYWGCQSWTQTLQRAKSTLAPDFPGLENWRYPADFIVTSSEWYRSLLSKFNPAPSFTFHPIIPAPHQEQLQKFPRVDVSMLNTSPLKGSLLMVQIISEAASNVSFRAHHGGWGASQESFLELLEDSILRPRKIEYISYVANMASFFSATRVFIFPSRWEGYGMVGVEALAHGTPVIATDLPGVREGVGNGGILLPLTASSKDWLSAIQRILKKLGPWRARARKRGIALFARQEREANQFIRFITNV